MSFGVQIEGNSQEKSNIPEGSVVQQLPISQQPNTNPRMKSRGLIATAELSVTPLAYIGPCPAVFTLRGQIYANRAMTVLYKIVRSDNVPMEPAALNFEKEERKEITYTWQLGGPVGSALFNEWALIEAVYPLNTKIRSNVIYLKGGCGNQADLQQRDAISQPESQKGQPIGPTGFSGPSLQGKVPEMNGPSVIQPGQKGKPTTGGLPFVPVPQNGPGPVDMPLPQPGQTGPGPSDMSKILPVQKGPMPGEFPMPSGNGKGLDPGNVLMPQPGVKTLPGIEK